MQVSGSWESRNDPFVKSKLPIDLFVLISPLSLHLDGPPFSHKASLKLLLIPGIIYNCGNHFFSLHEFHSSSKDASPCSQSRFPNSGWRLHWLWSNTCRVPRQRKPGPAQPFSEPDKKAMRQDKPEGVGPWRAPSKQLLSTKYFWIVAFHTSSPPLKLCILFKEWDF